MSTHYEDKTFTCACGKEFLWNSGEQKFMDSLLHRGKINEVTPPKRCFDCRAIKKERFKEADAQRLALRK